MIGGLGVRLLVLTAGWLTGIAAAVAQIAPQRVLGLQGAPNFRDLGGYQTSDGRHVRWGAVYRSNKLSALTDADMAKVDALHIVSEVDLRTAQERGEEPDRWLHRPGDIYVSPKPRSVVATGSLAHLSDVPAARAAIQNIYAGMPDAYRDEYAAMFRRLAAGREPMVVHCTAGKDRTGVAAAILLEAVGVPRQTAVADYTMSERLLPPLRPVAAPASGQATPGTSLTRWLSGLKPNVQVELWRSEDSFVLAALHAIDREYGSVDGYLKNGLKLSDAEVNSLRQHLTD